MTKKVNVKNPVENRLILWNKVGKLAHDKPTKKKNGRKKL